MRLLSRFFIIFSMSLLLVSVTYAQPQTIILGEPIMGELTILQPTVTYSFEGREGDVIYFYISPANLDQSFYGRLFDANTNIVAETGGFPFVNNIVLPATQTYTLLIGNDNGEAGVFHVLVDFYQPTPIVLDTALSGNLVSSAQLGFYAIEATQGQLFRYSSTGSQLGVSIFDPLGDLQSFQGTFDSPFMMLSQFTQTGQYLIIISTSESNGLDYTFFLESVNPTPLIPSTPVAGTAEITSPPVFSFQSPAGKAWELNSMFNGDGDRRLFVAQLEGRPTWDIIVASDFGSGSNGNPRINPFIAPADATYYVWLEFGPYNDTTRYDYEVTLNSTTIFSLAPDVETTHTITSQTGALTFVYTTTAENQRIELDIKRISDTGAISLQILSPIDEVLFTTGRSMNAGLFDLDLPVAGLYRFVVNDVGYESPELTITIRLRQLQDK